jgi:hypothetical protein
MQNSYFIAQDENTQQFLTYDKKTETVGWSANEEDAAWDEDEPKVQQFISRPELGLPESVKPKQGTGLNHPPRPPMSAM